MYKYYCYILKVYPRHYPKKIISPALRVEINKMNEISQQTKLLVSNKIKTYEQLLFYKDNLNNEIEKMVERRNYLWIKIKRISNENDKQIVRNEIDNITERLNFKRKEVKLCEQIEKRSEIVEKNIDEFENEKRREKEKI